MVTDTHSILVMWWNHFSQIFSVHEVSDVRHTEITSKHDCVLSERFGNLNTPKRLANCKIGSKQCSAHPYRKSPWCPLYCTKKSHRGFWELRCDCKVCEKNGPTNLKRQCVNKLGYLLAAKTNCANT